MHQLTGSINPILLGRIVTASAGQRLREERERLGISQRAAAALVAISKNTQAAYEAGTSPISLDYLEKLRPHGFDVAYIAVGNRAGESPHQALHDAIRRSLNQSPPPIAEDGLDLVKVDEIDLAYGLGGTFSDVPVETQSLHFPRTWLESITKTPPALLTFARGRGDSMMPTLMDNDIVLIDRSQRTVREQDAVWALTVGDIAMIKRLRVRGERVSILSDNDRVPPGEAHPDEINIVGRVVFIGRRL